MVLILFSVLYSSHIKLLGFLEISRALFHLSLCFQMLFPIHTFLLHFTVYIVNIFKIYLPLLIYHGRIYCLSQYFFRLLGVSIFLAYNSLTNMYITHYVPGIHLYLVVWFSEIGSHHVTLAALELTL